jgi:hypothetical protein
MLIAELRSTYAGESLSSVEPFAALLLVHHHFESSFGKNGISVTRVLSVGWYGSNFQIINHTQENMLDLIGP